MKGISNGEPCRKCGRQFLKGEKIVITTTMRKVEPHAWLCEPCFDKWLKVFNNYKGRRVMTEDDWFDAWDGFVGEDYVKPIKVIFT